MPVVKAIADFRIFEVKQKSKYSILRNVNETSSSKWDFTHFRYDETFHPLSLRSVKEKNVPACISVQTHKIDGTPLEKPIEIEQEGYKLQFVKEVQEELIKEERTIPFHQDDPSLLYNVHSVRKYVASTEEEKDIVTKMNEIYAKFEALCGSILYLGRDKYDRKYFCRPEYDGEKILLNNFMIGCI